MKERIEERRTLQRRHLLVYLDIVDKKTGDTLGRLGDISSEGLLVISKESLPLGEVYDVEVKLPDIRGFQGDVVDLKVKTCWSSPDINQELSDTGCSLIDPGKEQLSLIRNLIKFLGFNI